MRAMPQILRATPLLATTTNQTMRKTPQATSTNIRPVRSSQCPHLKTQSSSKCVSCLRQAIKIKIVLQPRLAHGVKPVILLGHARPTLKLVRPAPKRIWPMPISKSVRPALKHARSAFLLKRARPKLSPLSPALPMLEPQPSSSARDALCFGRPNSFKPEHNSL